MKKYSNCLKKIKAREVIIISYQDMFYKKMPKEKQFISLCSIQDGENCEIDQLLKSGLIKKQQYFGIDYNSDVIEFNKNKLPECNWLCGHMQYVMRKELNPGIVNIDTLYMPEKAINLAADILKLLNRRQIYEVMVVINMILKNRHHRCERNAISKAINSNNRFLRYFTEGEWQTNNDIYMYNGTGSKSKSIMGTIILYKI
jgi:hypothetical protein